MPGPARRLLFVKHSLAWPRASGHDVHTYHLMKAMEELGHEVRLAVDQPVDPRALEGTTIVATQLGDVEPSRSDLPELSLLQRKIGSYWGADEGAARRMNGLVESLEPDAVIVVGLELLPLIAGVRGPTRVWYAADEWVAHHLSLVRLHRPATWREIRQALVKGISERAFAPLVDRAWVVSSEERRAMQRYAGIATSDVVPNGVDVEFFAPRETTIRPHSAVFWGRLDFGPNIQALQWLCDRVWPQLTRERPDAELRIYGFAPTPPVERLGEIPGVRVLGPAEDLRPAVSNSALVLLPFVSGGGLKNKLLEAAALGRPIVSTPRGCGGLQGSLLEHLAIATTPEEWTRTVLELWDDPERQATMGRAARAAVVESHSWQTAAQLALAGIEASLG